MSQYMRKGRERKGNREKEEKDGGERVTASRAKKKETDRDA